MFDDSEILFCCVELFGTDSFDVLDSRDTFESDLEMLDLFPSDNLISLTKVGISSGFNWQSFFKMV